jgi:hypothetical protein
MASAPALTPTTGSPVQWPRLPTSSPKATYDPSNRQRLAAHARNESVTDQPREMVIRSRQDETHRVLVSVTDSGVGISAENGDRLFNPFFTTKSGGRVWGCRSAVRSWQPTPAVGHGNRAPRRHVSVYPAGKRKHCVVRLRPSVQIQAARRVRYWRGTGGIVVGNRFGTGSELGHLRSPTASELSTSRRSVTRKACCFTVSLTESIK